MEVAKQKHQGIRHKQKVGAMVTNKETGGMGPRRKLGAPDKTKKQACKKPNQLHGSSVPASGTLKRKAKSQQDSYTCKHFMRKHLVWLVNARTQTGQSDIDFDTMSLEDLSKFVPDQLGNLSQFGKVKTAGELGRLLQQPPRMTSCILCLLSPVVRMTKNIKCALEAIDHHPTLIAIVAKPGGRLNNCHVSNGGVSHCAKKLFDLEKVNKLNIHIMMMSAFFEIANNSLLRKIK